MKNSGILFPVNADLVNLNPLKPVTLHSRFCLHLFHLRLSRGESLTQIRLRPFNCLVTRQIHNRPPWGDHTPQFGNLA